MKLVQINTVCNASTGKIMCDIQKQANKAGFETISFYGRRKEAVDLRCEKIGGFFSFWFHVFITTIFDKQGHGSYFETKKLIRRLKEENPDIIHMHNIHGYYINYKMLFNYLKLEYRGKIFWTFHDCWPFTGHCAYFDMVNCNKWKKQCNNCPNKKQYPVSLFGDRSYKNYLDKKKNFLGLENLTIITPSNWLNKLVKKSFLKEYKVVTINNGIDNNIFKLDKDDGIKEKYHIPKDKKILLGVASIWEKRKGLLDFIKLSEVISEDYIIVLVGLTRKQIKKMPANILGIERTELTEDLRKIYSISKVFINLTYEDNYPTVNLEAIFCGTPVISYDTGGCREQVQETTGVILKSKSIENLYKEILKIDVISFDNVNFINLFLKEKKYDEIIRLYRG